MRKSVQFTLAAVLAGGLVVPIGGSSHREAPLSARTRVADNTDVYAFVSPDQPDTVTLIANWIPLEEPAGGPNFYKFGDDVAVRDQHRQQRRRRRRHRLRVPVQDRVQNPDTFLYNTGPVTSLDDRELNVRQTYTVTRTARGVRTVLGSGLHDATGEHRSPLERRLRGAGGGSRPHACPTATKVFAGQRDDPFFVDLGSVFDLLGLRPFNPAHAIPLADRAGRGRRRPATTCTPSRCRCRSPC